MFETLFIFPISFWVVIGLLAGGGWWARGHIKSGIGLPMLAVLGTTAVWYVGDAFYNDYANNHVNLFTPGTLDISHYANLQGGSVSSLMVVTF